MELELGLHLLVQGLPAIAQIFTALQEERLARLKHQQAKETQLSSPTVRHAISQEKLGFQTWGFEQEKSLQQQLAAYDRETQLNLASYQRETALQLPEIHKILNNWPLRLFPSQLLGSHNSNPLIPLRIFLSPPKVQSTQLGDVAQALPEIEQSLAQTLGEFLSQNYSLGSQERPTEFLAGAWENKRFHREASIKALFEMLKSEPTLILESEFVGDYLNFRIAYWGLGQKTYSYKTIISRLDYRKIVYTSAKSRALKWKETANRLLACGESLEDVNRLGGDNAFNLKVLEKEDKWKQQGIDTSELVLDYKVNTKDFEALSQLLITCHCLVAGWVADAHHLVHYDVPPLLPELLPGLLKNASDQQLVQEVMETTILNYKDIFKALEIERPLWVPELALKLAQSLACLPDKSWAKEQVDYSLKAWLKQHQVPQSEGSNSLEAMPLSLTREDQKYFETLKECFATVGDDKAIAQVNRLLCAIKDLKPQAKLETVSLVQLEDDESLQGNSYLSVSDSLSPKPLLEKVSLIHTLTGHSGKAASIAVSVDGQLLASGSDDHTIKLWHLGTGKLLHTLIGESGRVLTIALSPDGQILASSHKTSDRSCIKIWHLGTGKLLRTLTGHHKWIYSLAISPDGQTLVSGGYKIKSWNLNTGEPLHTLAGHKKSVYSLAISPSGETLVSSGGDKTIKIWHLGTGELLRTLTGHSDWVRTLAISPDGQFLASGSDDHTIKLWHLNTGKLIRTLTGHTDWVVSLVISPDRQTLISGSRDNTIKLWNLDTGKLLRTLTGHKKWVYSLAVSPDGQTLASGSDDKTIKIWQAV
jgi:WD40 repeat protein